MLMKCDVCGKEILLRTHDGRKLCKLHQSVAVPMGKLFSTTPDIETVKRTLDDVSGAVSKVRDHIHEIQQHSQASVVKAETLASDWRDRVKGLAARVEACEVRMQASENALGNTQSILGDFFTNAEATTQASMLVKAVGELEAKIAGYTAMTQQFEKLVQGMAYQLTVQEHLLTAHRSMTLWQKIKWVFSRRVK